MFYKNAKIYCSDFAFRMGGFEVVNGKFADFLVCSPDYSLKQVYHSGTNVNDFTLTPLHS